MAKPAIADEVQVLRFFETGPLDKAEVLFNIVSDKMRERLRGEGDGRVAVRSDSRDARRREPPANRDAPVTETAERSPTE